MCYDNRGLHEISRKFVTDRKAELLFDLLYMINVEFDRADSTGFGHGESDKTIHNDTSYESQAWIDAQGEYATWQTIYDDHWNIVGHRMHSYHRCRGSTDITISMSSVLCISISQCDDKPTFCNNTGLGRQHRKKNMCKQQLRTPGVSWLKCVFLYFSISWLRCCSAMATLCIASGSPFGRASFFWCSAFGSPFGRASFLIIFQSSGSFFVIDVHDLAWVASATLSHPSLR